jgi:TruD family tRNA pseudouridine synthase
MEDRLEKKQQELAFLKTQYAKTPELFPARTFIEDATSLAEFGIHIPGKEHFQTGVLKLLPQDFIVEEVAQNGTVNTIVPEDISRTPAPGASYLFATLVKCNMSTLEAVNDIAHTLHISKDDISYAGMKDKDALTSQRISVRGVEAKALLDLNSPYFLVKDIAAKKGHLKKGDLKGNRFTILIRTEGPLTDENASRSVAQALSRVHENGFYNFYYLQRFGLPRLCNYRWALSILKGNYEEAVRSIFTFEGKREIPYILNIRKELKEHFGDWNKLSDIMAPFPILFTYERIMAQHLLTHPHDYAGALQAISEQVTIWVHALTSIFFNQKISDYLLAGEEPPPTLPFFISPSITDQQCYKDMLELHGLYPVPLKNLSPFSELTLRARETPTKDRITIHKGEILPEGLLLEFELGKGQYATTFLSHLFNLVSGKPPVTISDTPIDSKKILGDGSVDLLLERFGGVMHEKGDNLFDYLT